MVPVCSPVVSPVVEPVASGPLPLCGSVVPLGPAGVEPSIEPDMLPPGAGSVMVPELLLSVSELMSGAVIAPSSAGTVALSDWLVPSFGELQAASRRTAGVSARKGGTWDISIIVSPADARRARMFHPNPMESPKN